VVRQECTAEVGSLPTVRVSMPEDFTAVGGIFLEDANILGAGAGPRPESHAA